MRLKYAILPLLIGLSVNCWSQGAREVKTETFGTLKSQMPESEWEKMINVKISGPINAEDVAFLAKFAQKDSGNLSVIDLSDSQLYLIGNEAFNNCTNLTEIHLPESITAIGMSAFGGCSNLQRIKLPTSLTALGDYAFADCGKLEHIELPEKLEQIPSGCFADCNNLADIKIPDQMTSIGKEAFARCVKLKEINIPDNVTKIGGAAFAGCEQLNFIRVGKNNKKYCSSAGGVLYSKDGKYILQYPAGKTATVYTVPPGVIRVGSYSFAGCKTLQKITIPNSCTSVGYGAFYECEALKTIQIPNSITKIDEDLFYGCKNLETIELPNNISSIGSNAFLNCEKLKSIKIPSNVKKIGRQSFYGCKSLAEISIPNGVTSIEDGCFSFCTNLKKATLPQSVSNIGPLAFAGDISLETINMPSKLKQLGVTAFSSCTKLKGIELPAGLTIVSDATFNKCEEIKEITLPNSVDSVGMGAFAQCDSLKKINVQAIIPPKASLLAEYALTDTIALSVPAGSEEKYHNATGWKEFQHINDKYYPIEHLTPEPEMNLSLGEAETASKGRLVYSSTSNETIKNDEDLTIYNASEIETPAHYNGGIGALTRFLRKETLANTTSVQGVVKISMVVEKDGTLSNLCVVQSKGDDMDAEAISIINEMPQWIPAQKDGTNVRQREDIEIPINIK